MDGKEVEIIVHSAGRRRVLTAERGENLLAALRKSGLMISAVCGGRGRCGKCGVRVRSGKVSGAIPNENGTVLSCLAEVAGPLEIEIDELSGAGLLDSRAEESAHERTRGASGLGVALDIGTTTLAFYLHDLATGEELDRTSCLNPQAAFGGDVVSRISACVEGRLPELHALIRDRVRETLEDFCARFGADRASRLVVCGNTTMLHLFKNVDASPLGVAPFRPRFLDLQRCAGKKLGLPAEEVVLLPGISAYVGADISAGILACDLGKEGVELLADIGTNGEMAIAANGRLLCTSTAAGPALEGANIACGTGGIAGAIDKVWTEAGEVRYTTIGNAAPVGICGCGLTDAIRVMLDRGVIDETGAFAEDAQEPFPLAEGVFVTAKDVREFQLAKSAICAGLRVLLRRAGVQASEVKRLCVAGGLGFYLDPVSAGKTGLLPAELADRTVAVGNSAGAGARRCLLSDQALEQCARIAQSAEVVDLAEDPDFMDEYIADMMF